MRSKSVLDVLSIMGRPTDFDWDLPTAINRAVIPVVGALGVVGNFVTLLVFAIDYFRPLSKTTTPSHKISSASAMYIYLSALRNQPEMTFLFEWINLYNRNSVNQF